MEHRAAPGDRRGRGVDEHPDRHDLHAVGDRREDHVVHPGRPRRDAVLVGHPEHAGDREAVHVGVDDADAQPALGESHRQVSRDRRLADAALAARDGVDAGEGVRAELGGPLRLAAPQALGERAALGRCHHRDVDGHVGHPGDARRGGAHVPFDRVGGRAADDRQLDADRRVPVGGHLHAADHVELGDRLADLGVEHGGQRTPDGVRQLRHGSSRLLPRPAPRGPRAGRAARHG